MLIERTIFKQILASINQEPKVNIIYGPRQSGKTTILEQIQKLTQIPSVFFNSDDIRVQEILGSQNLDILKKSIGNNKLVIIDEAQRVTNIGLTLKLIYDNLGTHIIASGSSSFDLANKVNEPLTGRTRTFFLYPLSLEELQFSHLDIDYRSELENILRFGLYPKTTTLVADIEKEDYLYEFLNTYLYKDILTFETVRKPKKVIDLLSLLALQIGSEVAISELASNLALAKPIVEKYLDLLEKMFVIVNIRGFSRNLRKEISKTSKYYFIDLGLRNALIRNFNQLKLRQDKGALFENFCIVERQKILSNHRKYANFYFWRTYDQKEIDLVEERAGRLFAYEFKWSQMKRRFSSFRYFARLYPNSILDLVTPDSIDKITSVK